jgi:hypothetical protein
MVRTLAIRKSSRIFAAPPAGTSDEMSLVGLAVQEATGAIGERLDDAAGDRDSADQPPPRPFATTWISG